MNECTNLGDYLGPDENIYRAKVPLSSIRYQNETVQKDVGRLVDLYVSGNTDTYPWEKLTENIKNGWDPSCRELTYHRERNLYSPFIVEKVPTEEGCLYDPYRARHRHVVLRGLGIDPVDCFVYDHGGMDHVDKTELERFVGKFPDALGGRFLYQGLTLPKGVSLSSRDNSLEIFASTGWPSHHWAGKTVLDVGCHLGAMALEAKRRGASRVVGFDLDSNLLGLAEELSIILGLDIELYDCDFWDFPLWGQKFDIVMANQCMYHFTTEHRCAYAKQHTEAEMLDRITGACKEDFFTYTFIHEDDKPTTYIEGYRPTVSEIYKDLSDRGFGIIKMMDNISKISKRTIVASKTKTYH